MATKPTKTKNSDRSELDDVLRRMLNTPPQPKKKPPAPAKPAKKKLGH